MKKDKKRIEVILGSLRAGSSVVKACKSTDITHETFYQWYKKDKRFASKVDAIRDSRVLIVEEVFYQKLVEGKAAPVEYIFYLKNRAPERWKDVNEHKVSGAITKRHKLSQFSDKELENILKGCGYVKQQRNKTKSSA